MYVKKIYKFLSSIKKMHTKENLVPFFCLMVLSPIVIIIVNSRSRGCPLLACDQLLAGIRL